MLKGITKIKGLGVYENYTKPSGTQEFGIKNLIYGWNYSGKTTLSRLFAQLEAKKPNPDLSGCEFSFETDTQPITEKNFEQCGLTVRVFNSDFVRDNLHFEGNTFTPILLLGKESEKAQKRIAYIAGRVKRSKEVQKRINNRYNTINQASSGSKTNEAKNIRQHLKIDPYTAKHLADDMLTVGFLDSQLLPEKDFSENFELAQTPDNRKPSTVSRLSVDAVIECLYKEAVTVLATTPTFSNTLKHLEEHLEIERWVETGLDIHPNEVTCEFCGNALTEDRLAVLRAHFSKDLAEHKTKIEDLLQRVKAAEIEVALPNEVEFNPPFRDAYKCSIALLNKAVKSFNQAVKTLIADVNRKADNPRKPSEPTPIAEGLGKAITDEIDVVNALIDENNNLAANFIAAKADSIKRLRYHYVQQFIDCQKAFGYDGAMTRLRNRHKRLDAYNIAFQKEVEQLQALISQAQRGREKINERLLAMLGSEAVQIVVVKDPATNQERFGLVRKNGKAARNLSDGERTSVAFSYFLTKLQELTPEEFKETIVYIDDPISSLDANHVFQITAAIRALFFKKENKNSPWQTICKQLFISTHNFEFFHLLRDIKPTDRGAPLFLINRISEKTSTFRNMPRSLACYQSEYHFLFEAIYRFHQSPSNTDHAVLMLLPNAIRRFVELYTYSRLPGTRGEQVDQRAESLFGVEKSKRILKVLHFFSHANTIDRLVGNNELIFDLEHAVKDLIEVIAQTDQKHMDALIASIQP